MLSWTQLEHGLVAIRAVVAVVVVAVGGVEDTNLVSGDAPVHGATVKARGLPYSASEYDSVDFFANYGVSSGEN